MNENGSDQLNVGPVLANKSHCVCNLSVESHVPANHNKKKCFISHRVELEQQCRGVNTGC